MIRRIAALALLAIVVTVSVYYGANLRRQVQNAPPERTSPLTLAWGDKPKVLVNVPVTVSIYPEPKGPCNVSVSLSMPSMSMPPNDVTLKPMGKGVYRGQCVFSMSGHWIATATASSADHIDEITVPVDVP